MRKRLILVVDDEPAIVRLVRAKLQADGYGVITANSGASAIELFDRERPDLVVLDLMMPEMDGFETLRRLHRFASTPVIMLTARGSDADKLRGFESGVDDYITKPFNPDELSARVAAVLRRAQGTTAAPSQTVLRYPNVVIDLDRRTVTVSDEEVRLSRTEWEVLSLLAENSGKVMMHGEMLSRIWGPEFRDEVHYLRTWVSRIRAKLEPDGDPEHPLIQTFPGIGYRLESPTEDA